MKRLLLDVDEVCGDIMTPALKAVGEVGGGTWDPATFPTWDVFDTVDHRYREATYERWTAPGWCKAIKPYPEALAAIPRLRQVADVRFVTAPLRGPHWMWERDRWLREHFEARSEDIVFTKAKYLVMGDVFVDDNAENVLQWALVHPAGTGVVWERPCHRGLILPDGIVLTRDWDCLLELVR